MVRKVLCLSGGGAKGVAQIQLLKKLEADYGKPLCEVYDLIAGTSVGAINASIIASGKISMDDLEKRYIEILERVFKKKWLGWLGWLEWLNKPKYDRKNFINEWDDLIGDSFLMGDVKTKLMLTSVDLVTDNNFFFKSWHDDDSIEKLVDITCRSFAAPMYFDHIVDKENQAVWSDGGVGNANLPLNEVKTQVESFCWYDTEDCDDDDTCNKVQIDAVGCLYSDPHNTFKDVSKQKWISQLLDVINPMNAGLARVQSRGDQIRMMKYLSTKNRNLMFRYWDMEIPKKLDKLDGVEYVYEYKKYGIEMSRKPIIDIS